jgi:hypothetical protein
VAEHRRVVLSGATVLGQGLYAHQCGAGERVYHQAKNPAQDLSPVGVLGCAEISMRSEIGLKPR